MKRVIGEYGMIVIAAVVASVIAIFGFGGQSSGFLRQIASVRPQPHLKTGSNLEQLKMVIDRNPPILEIQVQKLRAGERYFWAQFVSNAVDADGRKLEAEIICVVDPKGQERKESETIVEKGMYIVTYQITDRLGLSAKKEVCFAAD